MNTVFIATSLDGFIARSDGGLDWLDAANATVPAGEDCGYGAFMADIDALVMGRKTFEQVLTFGQWPYGQTPVVVLSSRPFDIPAGLKGTVSHSSETPDQLCARLDAEGLPRRYIDGGLTVQRFLAAGRIDEMTITLIPVLLGQGIPLFGPRIGDVPLTLVGTRAYDWGFVQLHYRINSRRASVQPD